jgi:phage terminase small subunit
MKFRALTEKEERYCQFYMKTGNKTGSYIEAGYETTSPRGNACGLHKKPHIQNRLAELRKELDATVGVTAAMIAAELKKIAFASVAHHRKDWVTLEEFEKLPDSVKDSIAEIQTENRIVRGKEKTVVKIKMHDKLGALQQLTKILGFDQPVTVKLEGGDTPVKTEHRVVFVDMADPTNGNNS